MPTADKSVPTQERRLIAQPRQSGTAHSRGQEAFDFDVPVHQRSVDAQAVASQFPLSPLLRCGVQQTGKPLQRGRDPNPRLIF